MRAFAAVLVLVAIGGPLALYVRLYLERTVDEFAGLVIPFAVTGIAVIMGFGWVVGGRLNLLRKPVAIALSISLLAIELPAAILTYRYLTDPCSLGGLRLPSTGEELAFIKPGSISTTRLAVEDRLGVAQPDASQEVYAGSNGNALSRLTTDSCPESAIAISPGGDRLAISVANSPTETSVYEVTTGSAPRLLLRTSTVNCLAWSPSARLLAVFGAANEIVNSSTLITSPLQGQPAGGCPNWSSSGPTLRFAGFDQAGKLAVQTETVPSARVRVAQYLPTGTEAASEAPDGRFVALVRANYLKVGRSMNQEFQLVNIRTGHKVAVPLSPGLTLLTRIFWSSDSRRVMFLDANAHAILTIRPSQNAATTSTPLPLGVTAVAFE